MAYDLVIRNARLPTRAGQSTLAMEQGRLANVTDHTVEGRHSIDAQGGLVTTGFVDCHVHLDKALIADDLPKNQSGTLSEAIENIHARKGRYSIDDVRERAVRAIELHVERGCTRIRTHVDVDTIGELTPLEGVLAAREACADIADVQIVAFPQEGILQHEGTGDLLAQALDEGADVIGGMPDNERTVSDTRMHVDRCLDLAEEFGVPVDMHVDETDDPTARSLEYLAAQTNDRDLNDVTAGHTCALAAYDEAHAKRVIQRANDAGLKFVTNPPTNLLLQGRHDQHPKRRGITRVDQLREAGLTVAAGQDCLSDGFYPYGRASMLETALITAHAAHLQTASERELAWEMVTSQAAAVMDIDTEVEEGAPAVLNVFPPSITDRTAALRFGPQPRYVIHDGRIVAETEHRTSLHRAG
jgi:cytosine deaminase